MKNKIASLCEISKVIQGEGKYAGIPHLLFRFIGCILKCRWCDSSYTSWQPEKNIGKTWSEIEKIIENESMITHAMITGGSPTMRPKELQYLCNLLSNNDYFITIETEGAHEAYTTADFISLSPKFSTSAPIPGETLVFTEDIIKIVSQKTHDTHEKNRKNYIAMKRLIESHPDFQIKPVITCEQDFNELKELLKILDVDNNKVYCMPEGVNEYQLGLNRQMVMERCIKEGYNYTDRLHIIVYGDKRGV